MEGTKEYPHQTGEFVSYRKRGIFKINEIRSERFGNAPARTYYVLQSTSDEHSVVYVPVDSEAVSELRALPTKAEIDSLIQASSQVQTEWIDDRIARAESFTALAETGSKAELLWLLKSLATYSEKMETQKKKLYASDARLLETVQKMITSEFSFVLGIAPEQVLTYILNFK